MFDYGSIWACTFFYLFYVNQKAFLRINVGSTVVLNACNSCNDIFSGKLAPPPPPPPPSYKLLRNFANLTSYMFVQFVFKKPLSNLAILPL